MPNYKLYDADGIYVCDCNADIWEKEPDDTLGDSSVLMDVPFSGESNRVLDSALQDDDGFVTLEDQEGNSRDVGVFGINLSSSGLRVKGYVLK